MPFRRFTQDPNARLSYRHDWAAPDSEGGPWLDDGDTIVASTWACDDPALILEDGDIISGTQTVIFISGGVLGQTYVVTNHITTNLGPLIDDRSIRIRIKST